MLRQKFSGKPEHVVNYFFFIAEEVRQIMAQLGIRKFDDLIGRADLLDTRKGIAHWKAQGLDFSRLFALPQVPDDVPRYQTMAQEHGLERALDNALIAKSRPAIDKGEKGQDHGSGAQRQPLGGGHALRGRHQNPSRGTAG